jgi:putative ABC transport system ATP-binding protein
MPLLVASELARTYTGGSATVRALDGISFSVDAGDFVALMGPSGCGKSTLLHLCGAMDRPTSGHLTLEGRSLGSLSDDELTRVRRERIGFVFQFFNLLPTLTLGRLAERVGIRHRLAHYPQEVSGGEMQRAAIARALVHEPALLIADEPTGNLDSDNGARVLALLTELNRELGITILLATHAPEVAGRAGRVLHMRDGRLADESAAGRGHSERRRAAATL